MIKAAIILLDIFLLGAFLVAMNYFLKPSVRLLEGQETTHHWSVQSVDTMKYSRDLAREKLHDDTFNSVIDEQVREIAETGATHLAVGTPYDEEFVPYLARWVRAARENGLKVWFRGNMSGWEEWFDYPEITPSEHTNLIVDFISANQELFEDGDVFTSCAECENGAMGDPRLTGGVDAYRDFLVTEYIFVKEAFRDIGKKVISNYYSMNGDVAKLVMDRKTTASLDGVVVVDHYVDTPEKLVKDVKELAALSGGKIVLGEFGAPIPDIHGQMSEEQQALWLTELFNQLSTTPEVIGMNYWVSRGGSTALIDETGKKRKAYGVVSDYYTLLLVTGQVADEADSPIANVLITGERVYSHTNEYGLFQFPLFPGSSSLEFRANGYLPRSVDASTYDFSRPVVLNKEQQSLFFEMKKRVSKMIESLRTP